MAGGNCSMWWTVWCKIGGLLMVFASYSLAAEEKLQCPQAIFAFGASVTDTGNAQAAFPYETTAQSSLPYGETFFRKPVNRNSNGRLIIDFFAQALKFPLLSAHFQSVDSNFRRGANFAFSGSLTQNNSYPWTVSPPFYFFIQTEHFRYFKERTLGSWTNVGKGSLKASSKLLTKPAYFQTGLYFITHGNNDFIVPLLTYGQTIEQVRTNISSISNAMVANVERLYNQGARTLMVFNIPPLGCYTAFRFRLSPLNMSTIDAQGCLATLNEVIDSTNSLIRTGLDSLRSKLADATIIHADYNGAINTLFRNGATYGFKETQKACCGAGGGEYNLERTVVCGQTGIVNGHIVHATSCPDPNSYINWDGVHITEAANRFVAKSMLQGQYLEPNYRLTQLCKLSFHQF